MAVVKHVYDHGLPVTQAALILEMQEWFLANSAHGSAPDESTIRQRVKMIWRAVKAA